MEKNKNQSGRSMVEMLGVLAVIGVLSVGGIYGYKTAMEHIEYNNFMNDVNTILAQYKGIEVEGDTEKKLNLGITPRSNLLKDAKVYAYPSEISKVESEWGWHYNEEAMCPGCVCLLTYIDPEDQPESLEAVRDRVNKLPFGTDPAMWLGEYGSGGYYFKACTATQEGYVMKAFSDFEKGDPHY